MKIKKKEKKRPKGTACISEETLHAKKAMHDLQRHP